MTISATLAGKLPQRVAQPFAFQPAHGGKVRTGGLGVCQPLGEGVPVLERRIQGLHGRRGERVGAVRLPCGRRRGSDAHRPGRTRCSRGETHPARGLRDGMADHGHRVEQRLEWFVRFADKSAANSQ